METFGDRELYPRSRGNRNAGRVTVAAVRLATPISILSTLRYTPGYDSSDRGSGKLDYIVRFVK
jgi:hypothetical protein